MIVSQPGIKDIMPGTQGMMQLVMATISKGVRHIRQYYNMGPSPLKYFCNIYKRDTGGIKVGIASGAIWDTGYSCVKVSPLKIH